MNKKEETNLSWENTVPIKAGSRRDMRTLAFYLIYATDRLDYKIPIKEIIETFIQGFNIEIEKNNYALKAARGTIRKRNELDKQIKPLLKNWKFERLGCCTRLILRLALWELNQKNAVPGIIINEAIELAKAFAEKDAYKFINGLLDEAYKKISGDKS
jgi:transcription antitermination protein NusB